MSEATDLVSAAAAVISAAATCVAAAGVWYARVQLRTSREIAQLQFEDGLAKEYRELANRLPTKALLGQDLTDDEYRGSFDELYRYVDLSNEQVSLRQRGRINGVVWESWRDGIRSNLELPAFRRAWAEIKGHSSSFEELRRLERENFTSDPGSWRTTTKG
jgi:hypothetical protein